MRAAIRINDLCQPPQVVILRGGGHTGDALTRLRRLVVDLDRDGFIEHVVLHSLLFVEGERATIEPTLELGVNGATQGVVVAEADVLIRVDAGDAGIGVAIATDGAGSVVGTGSIAAGERGRAGDARLLGRAIGGILRRDGSPQSIGEGDGSPWGHALIVFRAVGVNPAAAVRDFKGHALPHRMRLVVVGGDHQGIIARARPRRTRLHSAA